MRAGVGLALDTGHVVVRWSVVVLFMALFEACAGEKSCEDATTDIQKNIDIVCAEADFVNTPYCRCCVPNHYYSIDDTCSCQPLVLDVDFCFYESAPSGYPQIRRALVHAASVCVNRTPILPFGGDAGMCRADTDAGSSDGKPTSD